MPLTDDQKARLVELQEKEMLNSAEADELANLENIPETEEEESFDDAWDELEDGKSPSDSDDDNDDDDDDDDDESSAQADSDAGDEDDSTPGDESDNSDSGTGQTPDERDAEIAAMKQRMSSWEGRLKAADKRAADAEAKLKAMEESKAKAESDNDASLEDDDPELSEFFDEFPDLKGPITKVAEKIATKIVKSKLGDVDEIRSEVTAVKDTIREDSDQKHINDITEAHPDWKQIYESGKLEKWINSQPTYAQEGLYRIMKSGSTQEVIQMFNDLKGTKSGKKPNPKTTSLSDEKKKRAQASLTVPSSTGGPKKPKVKPNKDDFDGSWDYFEKKDRKAK